MTHHHNHHHSRSSWDRAGSSLRHHHQAHGRAVTPLGVGIGWVGGFLFGATVGVVAGLCTAMIRAGIDPGATLTTAEKAAVEAEGEHNGDG